ncbi:MAG: aspartate carbamoyltransferase [Gammaproteobacteria bacterium]|nr:aspartate carbamoyltransferase [Anaerolineae bacterium]MCB1737764.1 aspartate carbamoyltransferase [Gammaproteobacteria bacterium]
MVKTKLDPALLEPLAEPSLDRVGYERPRALLDATTEDLAPLLDLVNRPVVSARQFDKAQLVQLCRVAARYETKRQNVSQPLTGRILVSAFYEPSTRTRLSFESAWHRLGGDIMSITDPSSTGIAKGESLFDVGEMLNAYGDLVVLRDSHESHVYEMMKALRIPIVNAGNGLDEHPTQAMADIYALLKWQPELAMPQPGCRVHIGIIGVPARMRTVRSLLLMLAQFSSGIEKVTVITDEEEPFSDGQLAELLGAGLRVFVRDDLDEVLPELDAVYINAIAWTGEGKGYEELGVRYRLSAESPLKPGAIVLHPLARGTELDTSLDDTPHNWYFAQARGAVFVRMALLSAILKTFS